MGLINNSSAGEQVQCPRCGSTQIYVDKKGYSGGKACCGAFLVGPLGLLCGTHKANDVQLTCLKCKKSW